MRNVEIFSAGCPVCDEVIELVNRLACSSCKVSVADMHDPATAESATLLGIQRVPAVVVDGKLVAGNTATGLDEQALEAAGIGQPI
ncbi:MAG: thioredoxin family protein [Pseudomonadales bacterium]|jgi:thioredoxin-like negative regulator of GroEL|nr:thioredoxin family protein [Pseudomonadales bacterium]MDP7360311.1 thioredoxin family protein [Pseudomonadales bacterium]MDP7597577.1 thioredoxin family protein [Pseudomonadales bacterium]HJN50791.1 thioredoxin family protein [Pseudomonadales bacterium]|tara:strand:+ start:754 stop:1011 length:258 start_codon:yes stop_codon:yes gene_type:complete